MKILIPALKQKDNILIAEHFGRAPQFLIYDLDNNSKEIIANPAITANTPNERRRILLNFFSNIDFSVVITKEIGPGMFDELKNNGKLIYLTTDRYVDDAINKFKNNELKELTSPNE